MLTVVKSTHVHAPAKAVFAYVTDTARNPEWIPSLMEVHDIVGQGPGKSFKWTYKMAGVKLHGESEVVEWARDALVVTHSSGSVRSTWTHAIQPEGDGSRYTLTVAYEIPASIGGRFTERLLRRRNEREGEMAVQNLQEHVEALIEASME